MKHLKKWTGAHENCSKNYDDQKQSGKKDRSMLQLLQQNMPRLEKD
jgi:hypothetical protein